jgi:hypothetical protein
VRPVGRAGKTYEIGGRGDYETACATALAITARSHTLGTAGPAGNHRGMRWALFQQVMQKLVGVREFDPKRDAARYAEQLLEFHPRLFAQVDGGSESVAARMAARTIAVDHLGEICRLPTYVDELQRSLAVATMRAGDRLVRVAALAYLVCERDLIRDDLPAGYGLIDDCISIRGAMLATPGPRPRGGVGSLMAAELLRIRYLALAVPDDVLAATEQTLTHSAMLAARTRDLPDWIVERAIRELVEQPPTEFPAPLPLPDPVEAIEIESMISLTPGELVEVAGESLVIEFPDGSRLRREAGGVLVDG